MLMSKKHELNFVNQVLVVPLVAIIVLWTIYWVEISFQINLSKWGVYPRTTSGLKGILTSPLVHGSMSHLYNNSLPLVVLLAALIFFYKRNWKKVLILGWLGSGLLTWCIGRASYHIGASGLIYVLVSFIFFKGIRERHFRLIALSLLVVFLYGSMLWYIFPVEKGISWEGHLSGFAMGYILAYFLKSEVLYKKKYAWEKEDYQEEDDPFMRQFDKDGNFIERKEEDATDSTSFLYHYKKDDED